MMHTLFVLPANIIKDFGLSFQMKKYLHTYLLSILLTTANTTANPI